ncbi:heavy metal RND transporter [Georhizobium profundi]|jgi:hypothetical protein|uniref:Heavy metal RND transporter n=1 Tax=Georhizobium profundi TaxID=2341112 RepID=A0A3S9B3H1_9HYPH|nr:FixH family protein [Georhizobium profundi]AZN71498.1 heavy metal RND transporter [Georhizobium profundi]
MNDRLAMLASFLASASLLLLMTSVLAADEGFRFEIVDEVATVGDNALTVRLIDAEGNSVPRAVIYALRLDMAPDGMAAMTAPLQPVEELDDGLYRFRADLMMEGNWRLQIAAKIQGETETVTAELPLEVLP